MPTVVSCGYDTEDLLTLHGPAILVQISFDPNCTPETTPAIPASEYHALVDTGAFNSCIDSSVAQSLGLPIVDSDSVSAAHGAGLVNFHLAQMYVPSLNFISYGRFAGVHLHAGGQPYSALIGRSFLRYVKLEYDGTTSVASITVPD